MVFLLAILSTFLLNKKIRESDIMQGPMLLFPSILFLMCGIVINEEKWRYMVVSGSGGKMSMKQVCVVV